MQNMTSLFNFRQYSAKVKELKPYYSLQECITNTAFHDCDV